MGGGYTKLFSGIVLSSVWGYDDQTRIVWLTMLALADKDGTVTTSVSGLAHVARVPVDAVRRALEIFLSPDPDSSTKDDDGRRIVPIDRGWRLLNHGKFRRMMTREEKKIQDAERVAAKRAAEKTANSNVSPIVASDATKCDGGDSPASASASESVRGLDRSGSQSGTPAASDPDPKTRAILGTTEQRAGIGGYEIPESPEAVFALMCSTGGELTGRKLAVLFAQVRVAEVPGSIPWTVPKNASNRDAQAADIDADPAALADVVPTMRMVFALAREGKISEPTEMLRDPSFAFGHWCSKFTKLREQLRGIAPAAVEARGSPRNAAVGYARASDSRHKGGGTDHEF